MNTWIHRSRRFLPIFIFGLGEALWKVVIVSIVTAMLTLILLTAIKFLSDLGGVMTVIQCCVLVLPFVFITLGIASVRTIKEYREQYKSKETDGQS